MRLIETGDPVSIQLLCTAFINFSRQRNGIVLTILHETQARHRHLLRPPCLWSNPDRRRRDDDWAGGRLVDVRWRGCRVAGGYSAVS